MPVRHPIARSVSASHRTQRMRYVYLSFVREVRLLSALRF
jgi:hypothetical protein